MKQHIKTISLIEQLKHLIRMRPDKTLIVGCSNRQTMLDYLSSGFSENTDFELVEDYGIKIIMRE